MHHIAKPFRGAALAASALPDRPGLSAMLPGGLFLAATILGMALMAPPAQSQEAQQEVGFISAEGADIGTATLTPTPAGLLIELDLHDLTPNTWHGFHIHETGVCDAEDGFKSAGGHFAGSATEHGFLSAGGPHVGDMPNQYVASDGTLKAQVLNTMAVLGGDTDNVSGRAFMLHGGPDDYQSQPSGAAGDRVGCAVIPG